MSAFFARQQGGTIAVLKLIKLLYLSDRASMAKYGAPISGDCFVSMDYGPVPSQTLNLLNGAIGGAGAAKWEEWISDRANHDVSLKRDFRREDLDQLSDADLEILQSVWAQFGHMDKWTISDWTHKNCPEWKDPQGSSIPIDEAEMFSHLGKKPEEAEELARRIHAERDLDRVLASL